MVFKLFCVPPPSLGCDGGFLYTIAEPKNRGIMMTVEERLDQLKKLNRRLTAGLMMTVGRCVRW